MFPENLSIMDLKCLEDLLDNDLSQTCYLLQDIQQMNNLHMDDRMDDHIEALTVLRTRSQKALIFVRAELYKRVGIVIDHANKITP